MTCYKLFVSSIASGDGLASLDIAMDGQIVGIQWAHAITGGAASSGRLELSFASSNGLNTNDTRSSISTSAWATTGANQSFNTWSAVLPGVPVTAGERLFLHHDVESAPTSGLHCVHIYVADKSAGARRTRV